jgi:hypothetical protein
MRHLSLTLPLLLGFSSLALAQGEIPLDDVRIEAGEDRATVHEVPWSGSWWPFSTGKLSQGYHGDDNFTYDEDTEDFTPVDGIDDHDLAPLRKYDLFVERRHGENPGAAYLELKGDGDGFEHHIYGAKKQEYDDEGISYGWWGHCNGWAAAAIMEREPYAPITAEGIRFDVADLKGLLTESYWGVRSYFSGRRYNKPSDEMQAKVDRGQELLDALDIDVDGNADVANVDSGVANVDSAANVTPPVEEYIAWYEDVFDTTIDESVKPNLTQENFRRSLERVRDWAKENYQDAYEDIYAHNFHKILVSQIKNRGSGVVFDTSADEEVWNFPAYHYESTITLAAEQPDDGNTRYNVETTVYYGHDGVSESILGVNALVENYTYDLICDADGRLVDGEWTGWSVDDHPDFAWVPTYNPRGRDSGENPNMLYGKLLEILAVDHEHGDPQLELLARLPDGTTARRSERIEETEATTWTNPLEVQSPVSLAVGLQANSQIATVRYYRQTIENGSWRPTVARDGLTLLAESTAGGDHAVSVELTDEGKTLIVAYGVDAQDRVIAISELTLDVTPAPPPPPVEDSFEENDSRSAAAALALGRHEALLAADDDWYRVSLAEEATLEVALEATGLTARIEDAQGAQLAAGSGTLPAEGLAAGDYFVHVLAGADASAAGYALELSTREPTPDPDPSGDDAFEENDSRDAAAALTAGTHTLTVEDDDWFAITVAAGARARVDIAFSNADGDLDMSLVDANGTQVDSSTSVSDQERVSVVADAAATYYVRVYGYGGATNAATITLTVDTPPAAPSDDAFEENDSRDAAAALSLGTHADLLVQDDDWFAVELAAGQTLTVSIAFVHANGDLDMEVVDADGSRLGASTSTSDAEQVSWTATDATTVYVRVYGYSGAQGSYSLTAE